MRTETLTFKAIFTDLVRVKGENFTRAGYYVKSRRPDGLTKTVSSLTPVHNSEVLEKLKAVKPGDEIEITIETKWNETGIPQELLAFTVTGQRTQRVA